MFTKSRTERLRREYDALVALRAASTILDFQTEKDPPELYTVTFRGRSVCRASSVRGGGEICTVHRVECRLPFAYPRDVPDLRWRTPIFHPNISHDGFMSLRELGIQWNAQVMLDALCERLWDVARFAYVNSDEVLNYAAQRWLDEQPAHTLPLDPRPLRDVRPAQSSNIVGYTFTPDRKLVLPAAREALDVLFIDEDTPTPELPRRADDDEVFYIGDE